MFGKLQCMFISEYEKKYSIVFLYLKAIESMFTAFVKNLIVVVNLIVFLFTIRATIYD